MRRCEATSRAAVLLATCLALPAAVQGQAAGVEAARAFRESNGSAILRDYAALLAIPNVAGDTAHIRRNAEAIRDALARRGVAAELWDLPGEPAVPPVVFGELRVPGARRTLGVYVHYDGQPADPAHWKTPPWRPVLLTAAREKGGGERPLPAPGEPIDPEWRLYARSASDDKAPLPAIFAALDALAARRIPLTSNLRFFFEGEEEAGSPHLRRYMEAHRDQLEVDAWLICDGPVHPSRRPQLVFGVRGVAGLEVTVYGAARPLHSGHYGNWAPNPVLLLSRLLASMKDEEGKVLIEGFYDSTAAVGEAERKALAALPEPDDALRHELGLAWTEGGGASLAERLLLPALNFRGLEAANVGEKAQNVIPATATASIDLRLVKGNDPARMLDLVEAHIRKQGYHVVREEPDLATRLAHRKIARVVREEGYPAARTAMDLPVGRQVAAAAQAAAGEPPLLVPTLGGSLPLYLFTELLARPAVIVPIVNHDNNQHAPDENLRLANLWYGIDLMGGLFTMP
jgi:acetylornithine deacetylase/succinyl-diaminopimelate desuccinylase-like protein